MKSVLRIFVIIVLSGMYSFTGAMLVDIPRVLREFFIDYSSTDDVFYIGPVGRGLWNLLPKHEVFSITFVVCSWIVSAKCLIHQRTPIHVLTAFALLFPASLAYIACDYLATSYNALDGITPFSQGEAFIASGWTCLVLLCTFGLVAARSPCKKPSRISRNGSGQDSGNQPR